MEKNNSVYSDFPRDLPYNLEAEQSVLGAILLDSDCVPEVMQYVRPESFYRQQHQQIFSIVMRKFIASEPIDFITILDEVCREGIFPTEQDAKIYLTQLAQIVPTTVNVVSYARIVKEKYYLRSLVTTFEKVVLASRDQSADSNVLMDMAEQSIFDIRQGRDSSGLVPVSDVLVSTFDRLQRLGGADRDEYLGIPTGYTGVDRVTTGLNKSDLLVLAARPGMGKTAFALNLAMNVARQGKKVAIFSLEMSNEQLVERLLSSEAFIPSDRMRKGQLTSDDWVNLAVASQSISEMPIYLDDTAGITIGDMKSKLRRLRGVSFVVIDYLQLMQSGAKRNENRVQEVSEMTRALKIMAKEFAIPVLVLSQLSRGPESRTDKRPMLSDLRESGSIEQDADIVFFLYRDSYYNDECEEPGIAECIVAKNRHGETGTIKLGWDGQYTKFRNVELARDEG
ncbi:MAG: replicative DNA helicase [Oscillospiraceae bacterium]|nr:replicative DNA helicase [Oscillospiraceae bacterium]